MDKEIPMDREEKRVYDLERIEKLADENGGIVKTADILALGIDYRRLMSFLEDNSVRRVKNGYYTTDRMPFTEENIITSMFPDGVLTMESALFCYGYLKQKPYGWSIAINKNTSKSRFNLDYPVVTPYYTEPKVITDGVTETQLGSGKMKIYTKDRLICDVLKYQEKMSREDFISGVFAYIRDPEKDEEKLMEYAQKRKVMAKARSMIGVWL